MRWPGRQIQPLDGKLEWLQNLGQLGTMVPILCNTKLYDLKLPCISVRPTHPYEKLTTSTYRWFLLFGNEKYSRISRIFSWLHLCMTCKSGGWLSLLKTPLNCWVYFYLIFFFPQELDARLLSFSNTCVPTSELCTHGLYQLELNQEKRNHSNDCFWRRERCHLGDPMCWLKGLERISFADTIEHHRPMELGELLLMGTTAKGATGRDIELQHMKDQTLPQGGSIWTGPLAPLVEGWGWGLGLKLKENNQQRCSFSFSPPAQRPSLLIQSAL